MITVRPARRVVSAGAPAAGAALSSAVRTLFQDRSAMGRKAVKRPGKCVQLLVVYHERQQSEQRVEREFQQWQRQQQQ
jgi:hypothetical protein